MAKKVDITMWQIYQTAIQKHSREGETVSDQEAMMLIKRADEINHERSFSFRSQKCRGNKYLAKILNENPSHFTLESKRLIFSYIHNGQIPNTAINHAYTIPEEDRETRRMVCIADHPASSYSSHSTGIRPNGHIRA